MQLSDQMVRAQIDAIRDTPIRPEAEEEATPPAEEPTEPTAEASAARENFDEISKPAPFTRMEEISKKYTLSVAEAVVLNNTLNVDPGNHTTQAEAVQKAAVKMALTQRSIDIDLSRIADIKFIKRLLADYPAPTQTQQAPAPSAEELARGAGPAVVQRSGSIL